VHVNPQRLLYWLPRLFAGIGLLLLAVAAVTTILTFRFVADSERADGTVVDLRESYDPEDNTTSYYPVVRFETADGRQIRFESDASTSDDVGDTVEVLYDPDDPEDAKLAGFFNLWGLSLIFGALGAAFTGVGGYLVHRTRAPSREDIQWLRRHGRRVQGRSPRVVEGDVVVNDQSPYVIEIDVHEPMRGPARVLRSEYLWFDPAEYLKDRETVDVYIDPEDLERYYVDVSFLPAPERLGPPSTMAGSVRPPP
jgi:Protein of unknown function (DUF3592)